MAHALAWFTGHCQRLLDKPSLHMLFCAPTNALASGSWPRYKTRQAYSYQHTAASRSYTAHRNLTWQTIQGSGIHLQTFQRRSLCQLCSMPCPHTSSRLEMSMTLLFSRQLASGVLCFGCTAAVCAVVHSADQPWQLLMAHQAACWRTIDIVVWLPMLRCSNVACNTVLYLLTCMQV